MSSEPREVRPNLWVKTGEGGPQNTSRTCPCCGHVSADNRQTQAKFECVECGSEENADVVGAINV